MAARKMRPVGKTKQPSREVKPWMPHHSGAQVFKKVFWQRKILAQ